jgi:hypothetical protein
MAPTAVAVQMPLHLQSLHDARTLRESGLAETPGSSEFDPVAASSIGENEITLFGVVELLLKDQRRLDQIARSPQAQRELIPRLLWVGLIGYTLFAGVLAVIFDCAGLWPRLTPTATWLSDRSRPLIAMVRNVDGTGLRHWFDGSALHLIAAFAIGLVGAIGVCLPSFYFYGLLAGVRTSMLHVTMNALKGLASGAVAVLGALPIYLAMMLGLIIFGAHHSLVGRACILGLGLPFVTGLYGTRSLYIGFMGLADTMREQDRCSRSCFLRRLLFAWSACYTAVTPVLIFAILEYLDR